MKKFMFFLLLFPVFSFSQTVYSEYSSLYFNGKYNLEVSFDKKENEKFDVWINAVSADDKIKSTGLKIKSDKLAFFLESINLIKAKYQEWSKIAKQNNVEDLYKSFDIKFPIVHGFFYYYDEWEFDYSVLPTAKFIIVKNSKDELFHLLLIESGEMQSSSNEFIKSKGLYIAFSSVEEIDGFIKEISPDTILKFRNKPKTEDLFK